MKYQTLKKIRKYITKFVVCCSRDYRFKGYKKIFRNIIRESNGLNPDQDRHFVHSSWVQTVCKGYQQMTTVAASKKELQFPLIQYGIL